MNTRLVCFARFSMVIVLAVALADAWEQPLQLPPAYIRSKIMHLQIDVEFKPDRQLSYGNRLVGDEIVSRRQPQYVLFLGDDPDTPLDKCRKVYVELSVFLQVKIGDKYQPQADEKVGPPKNEVAKR